MKICKKCNLEKSLEDFHKCGKNKDGLMSWCKICLKKWKQEYVKQPEVSLKIKKYNKQNYKENHEQSLKNSKKWREKNPEKVKLSNKKKYQNNREEEIEASKKYNQEHKEEKKQYSKKYYQKNKDIIKSKPNPKKKEWYQNNKEKIFEKNNKWKKDKRKNDPVYKLVDYLRSRIISSLKKSYIRKDNSTLVFLNCDYEFLKKYLESKFLKEMTWENHGIVWEIDHIIPISKFDLTNPEQQRIAFHYTNLQPLFKTTQIAESFGYKEIIGNRNKGNKML